LEADKINRIITKLKSAHHLQVDKLQTEMNNTKTALTNLEQDIVNSLADHPERKPLLEQVNAIKSKLNKSVKTDSSLDSIISKINNVQEKLKQIKQLDKGANQVALGAEKLNTGATELKKGTTELTHRL
jgi:X-X-X-Leu-X-X-Gly heptad repeat protein